MSQSTATDQLSRKLRAIAGDAAPQVDWLRSPAGKNLARRFQLSGDMLTSAATVYSIPERQRIVQQMRIGLSEFYVHLDRKRVQYGFDAVRALDLLEPSLNILTDGEFHQSIVQITAKVRDRHLVVSGRDALGASAVLPFTIERFFDGEDEKFTVTKIAAGFTPQHLSVGALVTHWNGIRIDRFVRLNANIFDGSHDAAAIARSVYFLTSRSLRRFAPPLEDWVDLDFEIDGDPYRERFTWSGITTDMPITPSIGRNVIGFGGDFEVLVTHQVRRVQFAPESFDELPVAVALEIGVPQILGRHFVIRNNVEVDVFLYGRVTTVDGTFAYVRLFNFQADNPDDIANALVQAFANMPSGGLILDMRGNSGGYIAAGERILQLLTNRRITLTRFRFCVTNATRAVVEATHSF